MGHTANGTLDQGTGILVPSGHCPIGKKTTLGSDLKLKTKCTDTVPIETMVVGSEQNDTYATQIYVDKKFAFSS